MDDRGVNGARELTFESYFRRASRSDRFRVTPGRGRYYSLGLIGEVGGILAEFKKTKRDQVSKQHRNLAREEIGDALWYLMLAADSHGVGSRALGSASLHWLIQHYGVLETKPPRVPSFSRLDRLAEAVSRLPTVPALLAVLARQCGALMEPAPSTGSSSLHRYAALLATLALLARKSGLTLDDVAWQNIAKTEDRWPGPDPRYLPLFDAKEKSYEQLPRKFTVDFVERVRDGSPIVVQSINGIAIGDPLTDNNDVDDGYRYHDVFHFAYAVHLGWSPVIRALLKVKRKSNKKVDTNQDGARATIIEEGIATWIFNYEHYNWFAQINEGDLDFSLLKQVRKIVKGYEVDVCPSWQWERAILSGMKMFKQLYENKGGSVTVDLRQRKLTYRAPRRLSH